jgi:hypothetical protein
VDVCRRDAAGLNQTDPELEYRLVQGFSANLRVDPVYHDLRTAKTKHGGAKALRLNGGRDGKECQ